MEFQISVVQVRVVRPAAVRDAVASGNLSLWLTIMLMVLVYSLSLEDENRKFLFSFVENRARLNRTI